jgi:hypothetical protein
VRVVVRLFILGLVCALATKELASKTVLTITAHTIVLMFVFIAPPQLLPVSAKAPNKNAPDWKTGALQESRFKLDELN